MDILISIIISGFAAGYAVEFISSLLVKWIPPRLVKQVLTIPLSFVALWALSFNDARIFVYALSAGFLQLVIMAIVDKPVEVTQVIGRR
jgi:hypothetical protein